MGFGRFGWYGVGELVDWFVDARARERAVVVVDSVGFMWKVCSTVEAGFVRMLSTGGVDAGWRFYVLRMRLKASAGSWMLDGSLEVFGARCKSFTTLRMLVRNSMFCQDRRGRGTSACLTSPCPLHRNFSDPDFTRLLA